MPRPARVVALLVAVALAVLVLYTCTRRPDAPDGPSRGTAAAAPWDPNPGASADPAPRTGTAAPAAAPADLPQAMPSRLPDEGTPVAAGAEVVVAIPWKAGESALYEIEETNLTKDRHTDQVDPTRTIWNVRFEVIAADGGAARLRITPTRWRFNYLDARGLPVQVDSDRPDDRLLEDPEMAYRFRPAFALMGQPLEFHVHADGRVADVDGFDAWTERYLAKAEELDRTRGGGPRQGPQLDEVVDTWTEYLFPAVGATTLKGGEKRPWRRVEPAVAPWSFVWTGHVAATRDDPDAFRLEFDAAPKAERTSGAATQDPSNPVYAVQASGTIESFHAEYRIARAPAGVEMAVIRSKFTLVTSRKTGGGPGQPQFAPTWAEVLRAVVVRRLKT